MTPLDRTQQRILGVLVEKELSVPDSYPLSENALVVGCNQTSNRDPVMDLRDFQVAGALLALQQEDWVARVEGGGRVARYRHRLDEQLRIDRQAMAVLAELLLRGPQAPGALKPRVARMGFHATPEQIEAVLRDLAGRHPALTAQLPLGPRERDRRWRHLLGDGSEATAEPAAVLPASAPPPPPRVEVPVVDAALHAKVAALEARIAALEQRLGAALRFPNGD